jgi:hypothetical protein
VEYRALKRARGVVVILLIAVVAGGAAVWQLRRAPVTPASKPIPTNRDAMAPSGVRVRVQVLNGTTVRGLARRATFVLRDHGFDVVETGNQKSETDTTLVYDLTGHPEWARAAAKLFTPSRVVSARDSSRYVDIAVVLGASWRAPAEPFYP